MPDTSPGELYGPRSLPLGVFSIGSSTGQLPRIGTRLGDRVIELGGIARSQGRDFAELLSAPSLDPLLTAGRGVWSDVRGWLLVLVAAGTDDLDSHRADAVAMQLPFTVADYVDFYASAHHASNIGAILRPGQPALLPNWKHLPVGYHGRAGTVVVSGTDIAHPHGQRKPPDADRPIFGPSQRLDIEVELGFVVGVGSRLGTPVSVAAYADHVFGVVLVNDWSARDIQAWEYVPLGPFLGKSFGTSISAWVLPLDALADSQVPLAPQDPPVLDYLRGTELTNYDIAFEVWWNGELVSRPAYREMYWSPAQMLAHLTVNGASIRTGDLYASGTVSGPERDQRGSLLELTWAGRDPVQIGGEARTFLRPGDEVRITGWARRADGSRIGVGEVSGRIIDRAG